MIFNNPKFDIEIWLEWFYLNREIGRILLTIMHKFYGLLLFTSRYFALGVSICFTVQENSLWWKHTHPHFRNQAMDKTFLEKMSVIYTRIKSYFLIRDFHFFSF